MNETEQRLSSDEQRKEQIRKRYKGVDESKLSVIPAKPDLDVFDKQSIVRVAIYARVSTDDPNQTSSYELQKNYYTDLVNRNPNWNLVDIYADEGISGTSLEHRDNFVRMIEDCKAGKIDLIVTKSVSRFARNLVDGVGCVRMLGNLEPPVGVFFETENINSLKRESEMTLAILSTVAQEESHNKSEIMNASIEMRFKRGIFLTPPLLGYDQDENGDLVINEEEAKTVRLIFFMYIYGYSTQQIADTLTKLRRKTKKGRTIWYSATVLAQLTNERHCGSVLARKTYTPNYITHKSKKNRLNRNQYFQEEHHEPIISRKDFIYVQHIIEHAKNDHTNILPELHVIPDGTLSGYITLNPNWAGFKPIDYITACESVGFSDEAASSERVITVEEGDFDLRGYEIARLQFFNTGNKMTVTISVGRIKFSTLCLRKIDSSYVEILFHPIKKMFAVRKASKESRLKFLWKTTKNEVPIPRPISFTAISPSIFELLGWDTNNQYRLSGTFQPYDDDNILFFNASDSEIFIPKIQPEDEDNAGSDEEKSLSAFPDNVRTMGTKKHNLAYPASWADGFGLDYYLHRSLYESPTQPQEPIIISSDTVAYKPDPTIEVPDSEVVAEQIRNVMEEINQEVQENE